MTSEEDEFMDHAESFVADGVEYKVGEVIPKRITPNGTYTNEEVVRVFCQVCGSEFVGPIRKPVASLEDTNVITVGK